MASLPRFLRPFRHFALSPFRLPRPFRLFAISPFRLPRPFRHFALSPFRLPRPFRLFAFSPFRLSAERLALAGIAASWIAFVWLWEPAYLTLTVDDSFYYFQIARNVAEGLGSTFDGVQTTNGYHPLWMAILVPIAALPGDHVPVRMALTLQVLLVVGGTSWLGSRLPPAAGRAFEALVALALVAFHTTKILANGQESALQWFLLCVGIGYLLRAPAPGTTREALRQGLALGVLGSLVTLARLDAIAFGGFAMLLPVLWPRGGVARPRRWATTAVAAAVLGLVVAAYAVGNALSFGHPLPVSAVIKAEWAGTGTGDAAGAVVVALGVGAAMCLAGRRRFGTARTPRTSQGATGETGGMGGESILRTVSPLVVYVVFLGVAQSLGGWQWVLQIWYLPPLLLLGILTVVGLARYRLGRMAGRVGVTAGAVAYLAVAMVSWAHRLDPSSYSTYLAARDTGRWIREHLPEESRVAGWDVGIVAWHAGGGVTNLEGLAASWRYKREVLDRGDVEAYVRRSASHLVQPFPEGFLAAPPFRYESVDLSGWRLLHAECRLFEAAFPGARPHWRVHAVLAAAGPEEETLGARARRGVLPCEGDRMGSIPMRSPLSAAEEPSLS